MFVMIQMMSYIDLDSRIKGLGISLSDLSDVKTKFEDSYQYGGTWKSKKN